MTVLVPKRHLSAGQHQRLHSTWGKMPLKESSQVTKQMSKQQKEAPQMERKSVFRCYMLLKMSSFQQKNYVTYKETRRCDAYTGEKKDSQ